MTDLKPFCGQNDIRYWLNEPFSEGIFTYATNGHIIVRVPRVDWVHEAPESMRGKAAKLFADNPPSAMVAIPDIPAVPPQLDCLYCDGKGKIIDGGFAETCEDCDGTGKTDARQDIDINAHFLAAPITFAAKYLRLIKSLPNGNEISPNGIGPAWFNFDGGSGLLIPIRKD